jgi:hypothetical protein
MFESSALNTSWPVPDAAPIASAVAYPRQVAVSEGCSLLFDFFCLA